MVLRMTLPSIATATNASTPSPPTPPASSFSASSLLARAAIAAASASACSHAHTRSSAASASMSCAIRRIVASLGTTQQPLPAWMGQPAKASSSAGRSRARSPISGEVTRAGQHREHHHRQHRADLEPDPTDMTRINHPTKHVSLRTPTMPATEDIAG